MPDTRPSIRRRWLLAGAASWIAAPTLAQPAAPAASPPRPERHVQGRELHSARLPAVRIELPAAARYLGAERFVLFGVADCEIHLFADASADGRIARLWWVQFEGYLPSRPELRYTPKSPQKLLIGGREFHARARFGRTATDVPRTGSDTAVGMAMIAAHGLRLPEETINATLIHYLDERMRDELMVIVIEDLAATGASFATLVKDGVLQPAWEPIGQAMLQRAAASFTLRDA